MLKSFRLIKSLMNTFCDVCNGASMFYRWWVTYTDIHTRYIKKILIYPCHNIKICTILILEYWSAVCPWLTSKLSRTGLLPNFGLPVYQKGWIILIICFVYCLFNNISKQNYNIDNVNKYHKYWSQWSISNVETIIYVVFDRNL